MKALTRFVAIATSLAIAHGAFAQDQKNAKQSFPVGKAPEVKIGQTYAVETFDAWELLCVKVAKGPEPCEIGQLVLDDKATPMSDIRVFPLPPGQPALAGATIVLPLGMDLQNGMTITVDKNPPKQYPYAVCNNVGCVARIGITALELENMRSGKQAVITANIYGTRQVLTVPVSLKGFAKAYTALQKRIAKQEKAAKKK